MLDLLCPGLLGPVPDLLGALPSTPALDLCIGRADRRPAEPDLSRALLSTFGIAPGPGHDLPTAALCLFALDAEVAADGYWLHADPVHFRADLTQLRLMGAPAPNRAEANALVALLNQHFHEAGLRFLAPEPHRWYLRADGVTDLQTWPLEQVIERVVGPRLFRGADASHWTGLVTEVQMLLHGSAVNAERARRGQPGVNGIWPWGGGRLPSPRGPFPGLVVGDHPLVCGLARRAGVRHRPLGEWLEPDGMTPERTLGRHLVYWDGLWAALQARRLDAWLSELAVLESRLAPVLRDLRQGRLDELVIDAGTGTRYRTTRATLRRFWRRRGLGSELRRGPREGSQGALDAPSGAA